MGSITTCTSFLNHTTRLLRCVRTIWRVAAKLFRWLYHHIVLTLLNAILHGDKLRRLDRGEFRGWGCTLSYLHLWLLVHHLLTIRCISDLALWCSFCVIKVALILRRWIVHLHWFWSFLLCNIGWTWELCVQGLLQRLNQLWLLLFDISLIGVADKVDVLSLLSRPLAILRW